MRCTLPLCLNWHHSPGCGVLARLLNERATLPTSGEVEAGSAPDQENAQRTAASAHPLARHRWAVPLVPWHGRVVNCVLAPHLGNDLHRAGFALPACGPIVLSCGQGGNSELDIARAVAAFPFHVSLLVAVAVCKEDEADVLQRRPVRALATEGSERRTPSSAQQGRWGGTEPLANPCWGLHSGHRRPRIAGPRVLGLQRTALQAHALAALLLGSPPSLCPTPLLFGVSTCAHRT